MVSIYEYARGSSDGEVLQIAASDDRILITNDKDFGEMIFRQGRSHCGVILLRLEDERPDNKIAVLRRLIEQRADQLNENFVVVTENTVRVARIPGGRYSSRQDISPSLDEEPEQ